MDAPHLSSTCFPKLYYGQGKSSPGTVTGTGINTGYSVKVEDKRNRITWTGSVDSNNGDGSWGATVTRTQGGPPPITEDLETVSVTVTNGNGQTSNEVETESDEVP